MPKYHKLLLGRTHTFCLPMGLQSCPPTLTKTHEGEAGTREATWGDTNRTSKTPRESAVGERKTLLEPGDATDFGSVDGCQVLTYTVEMITEICLRK